MAKKFDLGDYLRTDEMSRINTNTEQIVYIDLDRIDPDPANFYSLDGIDELAGNIELIGLQQPLRVRPEGDRFTVISGHRRRAACLLIRNGGSEQFAKGVPCIVEYGEATPAMRELRLIYANSSTRVLSPAELSKQAERVQELLYELKKQGVEFPGRMREHVAAACRVSESKLARLGAIRKNLRDSYRLLFDAQRLPEGLAYRISQEPPEVQKDLFERLGTAVCSLTGEKLDAVIEQVKKPKTEPLEVSPMRSSFDAEAYIQDRTAEDLRYLDMTGALLDQLIHAIPGVIHNRREGIDALKHALRWSSLGGASVNYDGRGNGLELYRRGSSERLLRSWTEAYDALCTAAINRLGKNSAWDGEDPEEEDDGDDGPPRASAPTEAAEPEWQTGDPPRIGRYFCKVEMGDSKPHENRCWWGDDGWSCYGTNLKANGWRVVGWWPLPKERLVRTTMGDWAEETEE